MLTIVALDNHARSVAYLLATHYYYNHVSHDIIYCKVGKLNFPGNDMLVDGEREKESKGITNYAYIPQG